MKRGVKPLSLRLDDDAVLALAVALVTLAIFAMAHYPYLSSFALSGDDYALVQHSGRFFSPSLSDWIGTGYRGYNITFPELGGASTNFIRPVVNATVYLDSWLSSSPRSVIMLLSNYLGHAACVALVFLVGRSIVGLSRRGSLLASGLFLGSVAVGLVPKNVAYRGDMIATLFALISLLALHSYLAVRPAGWKVMLVGVSLLLALFAKESAVGAPLVLVIDVLWVRARSSDPEDAVRGRSLPTKAVSWGQVVLAIAVPSLLYAIARLAAGLQGMYVIEDLPARFFGVPRVVLEPIRFGLTTVFPVETDALKSALTGSATGTGMLLALARGAVAVGLNLLAWILILRLLLLPKERAGVWALLGMGLMASVVVIFKAEPRLMYFSQALFLPLFVYALTRWRVLTVSSGRYLPKWVLPVAVSLALLVGPSYYIAQEVRSQPGLVSDNEATRNLEEAILAVISEPRVHRLYLVNSTMSPGWNFLRFLAALGGRPDLRVRVVNTFSGSIPADGQGSVQFARQGDELEGIVTVGPSQNVFDVLSPNDYRQLGEPGVIDYGPLTTVEGDGLGEADTGTRFSFSIPNASQQDFAIVGLDPGREGVFVLRLPSMQWERVSP